MMDNRTPTYGFVHEAFDCISLVEEVRLIVKDKRLILSETLGSLMKDRYLDYIICNTTQDDIFQVLANHDNYAYVADYRSMFDDSCFFVFAVNRQQQEWR